MERLLRRACELEDEEAMMVISESVECKECLGITEWEWEWDGIGATCGKSTRFAVIASWIMGGAGDA